MSLADDLVAADTSQLSDLGSLTSDRERVLWVLSAAKGVLSIPWMTPGDIETVLRDGFGVHVPRQRIPGLLVQEPKPAVRRRVSGRFSYQILKSGLDELAEMPEAVTFIDPAQALSHIRKIEAVLAERSGVVRLCDPYVDGRTLDFLAECTAASEVRLVTANINKPGPFVRDLKAFRQQHGGLPIEVRKAAPGLLHDRYLIDDASMLIFGTSLNSFSRKQSFVVTAGEDIRRTLLAEFDRTWSRSAVVT